MDKQKTKILKKAFEGAHPSHWSKLVSEQWKLEGIYKAMQEHADQEVNKQTKELKEENERLEKELEEMTKQKDDLYNELYELKSQSSKEGITLPTDEEMEIKIGDRYHDHFYIKGFKDCFKWMLDLIQKQITK